jgi:uncharacterized membrane protein YesL
MRRTAISLGIAALRAVVALLAIVVAVKFLVPLLPTIAPTTSFSCARLSLRSRVYALVEFAVAWQYFRKLRRRYPS